MNERFRHYLTGIDEIDKEHEELVRLILSNEKDYDKNFSNFEALIKKHKNLSPQMIYDCGDFDIVYLSHI